MVRPLRRDASAIGNLTAFILCIVIVVAIVAVYFVYLVTPAPKSPTLAQIGDEIQIDYVGTFPNTGAVFDTSNHTVASSNASYPKAYSFTWRTAWTPLSFTIGDGSVVSGFDMGVRGLQPGESATLVVPQVEAYGPPNPALIHTYGLLQPVPATSVWNTTAFASYFKTPPVSGSTVTDPVWGWIDTVAVVNGYATVTASPMIGDHIRPYGAWSAVVQAIDYSADNGTGVITVANTLTPSMVDFLGGTGGNNTKFYLSSVDLGAGTYTLDYNRQVVGRTLVFQITVVSISRLA